MAEYWVRGVRRTAEGSIAGVCTRSYDAAKNALASEETYFSRDQAITSINAGHVFKTVTVTRNPTTGNNTWTPSATIEVVTINNRYYLKTVRNNTAEDNLGNLPDC